jgi:hypothetical protein
MLDDALVRQGDKVLAPHRQKPHVEVMSSLRPLMDPTRFVRWTITLADGRPTWQQALDRLGSA